MRFAYIDSQGKEVPIPTVDALRLRIALKAIVQDTMFFDASSERWAPARDHEIYRTLSRELAEEEEPGFVAPQVAVEGLDGAAELEVEDDEVVAPREAEGSDGDDWRFDISNAPIEETPRAPAAGADASFGEIEGALPPEETSPESGPEIIEGLEDIHVVAFDEAGPETTEPGAGTGVGAQGGEGGLPATGGPGGKGDAAGDHALEAEEGPIGSSSWVDLDMEGEEDARFDLDGVDLSDPPEPAAGGPIELVPELGGPSPSTPTSAPLEGLQQDRHDFDDVVEAAGWGDEPPPSDLEVEPTMVDPDAVPAAPGDRREAEPPLPSREELARRSAAARPAPAAGRGAPAGSGTPGPRARPPARRRSGGRGVGLVGVVAVLGLGAAGAAWWFVGQRGGADAAEPAAAAVAVPDVPEALQPHVEEVGPAVREETHASLRALPAQVGLPAEPPSRWLAGDYLAGASAFEDVEAYWSAMDRFLRTMQAREDSIFAATLSSRVAERGLSQGDAEQVEARILAGFRATARERGAVYQQARAVGESALRLHSFLRENEPSITYEPGVSSDPVLEAIPATPALGEDMWERVNEITEAMDALDFLDRVTTDRFVDAVIRRLEAIPLR